LWKIIAQRFWATSEILKKLPKATTQLVKTHPEFNKKIFLKASNVGNANNGLFVNIYSSRLLFVVVLLTFSR
jgi:hypothetical protein